MKRDFVLEGAWEKCWKEYKDIYHQNPATLIAFGMGAVVLGYTIISLLKPLAKATIKTGVIIYQKTKETLAETGEQLADIVAEAKAEVMAEKAANNTNVTPSE